MAFDLVVKGQFHLFWIHQHKFHLGRVPFVQQGGEDGIQPDGLSLSGGPRHQQVRHLGQVHHKGLVADAFAQGDWQLHFGILEFLGGDYRAHGNHCGFFVRDFDADGAFSGDRGNDPDPQGGQGKGDIVLQVLDPGNADTGFRNNFIECHGWPDGRFDLGDPDLVVAQRIDDLVLVLFEFFLVDGDAPGGPVGIQQVQVREFVLGEFQGGVEFPEIRNKLP